MVRKNKIFGPAPLLSLKQLGMAFLISTTVFTSLPFTAPVAQAATQNHYLWRNDDGSAAAAQDASLLVSHNANKRLRMNVDGNGSDYAPTQVASLNPTAPLASGQITSSVIDTVDNYAYLGSVIGPAEIIKVRLSDNTPVARLALGASNPDEGQATAAVIDTTGATHYAYFGYSNGAVGKIDLSTFTEVGPAINVNGGTSALTSAVIDTADGFAYFGTAASPGQVAKIDLSTFTEVGSALPLNSGENHLNAAVIDTTGGTHYAYFGTGDASPAIIVKLDLTTFTEAATTTLSTGGLLAPAIYYPNAPAVVDTTGPTHYAYFGLTGTPAHLVKFNLASFAEESSIALGSGATSLSTAGIDPASGHLYATYSPSWGTPVNIADISLSGFTVSSTTTLNVYNGMLNASVIDTAHDFAYFYSAISGNLVKVRLSNYTKVGELFIGQSTNIVAIDPAGGYIYVGINGPSASIMRVNLTTFTVDGTLTLTSGLVNVRGIAIDPLGGFAYVEGWVVGPLRTRLTRVRLSNFTEDGSIDFPDWGITQDNREVAADPDHHRIYFATTGPSSNLIQVDTSSFTITGNYQLPSDEGFSDLFLAIDTANQFAYMIAYVIVGASAPLAVLKVNLATMASAGVLILAPGDSDPVGISVDTANQFAYLTTGYYGAHLIQIDLVAFTEAADQARGDDVIYGGPPVIDPGNGYFYASAYSSSQFRDGDIIKFQVSPLSRSYRLEYGMAAPSCAAVSNWTQVGTSGGPEAWTMAASANIVTDGEATSDLPALDNNGTFVPGEAHDLTSETGPITLSRNDSTEVEFSIQPTDNATPGTDWCFRLTNAGDASVMTFSGYAEAQSGVNNPTTTNRVVLSRLKIDTVATADIYYHLADTLDGTLTVTFPLGFTVLTPATGGSLCLDNFDFTASTLTARKTGCSGDIQMLGATVQNPHTAGQYPITWVNDDPGGVAVYIVNDDQVEVTASVDPSITFDVGAEDAATACSGSFTGGNPDGGTVALGVIPINAVVSSDVNLVKHICTRLSTNATGGATVTVKSLNAGLMSGSNHADTIPSLTDNGGDNVMSAGTANYGVCVDNIHGENDLAAPPSALVVQDDPFKTSCNSGTAAGNVGNVTTSAQSIWHVDHATSAAYQSIEVKAAISPTTVAHTDYGDTLTFVATGTF